MIGPTVRLQAHFEVLHGEVITVKLFTFLNVVAAPQMVPDVILRSSESYVADASSCSSYGGNVGQSF